MSVGISKDCFPPASKCYNCTRKHFNFTSDDITRKWKQSEFKRCSGCHLLTYCDQDCQMEHWTKVHKKHCRFLSGRKILANSKYSAHSCATCAVANTASGAELLSANSGKTVCHVNQITVDMKTMLGIEFDFHQEDKKCHCSVQLAGELPFTLGEVSGEYVDRTFGLDEMAAHSLKIVHAMALKDSHRGPLLEELKEILYWTRINVWSDLLIYGAVTRGNPTMRLFDEVQSLETIYGPSNPWWKALAITVDIVENTLIHLASDFKDPRSLEDPRFAKLKLNHNFQQAQLSKLKFVSERNMWPKFKLWPTTVNGNSLEILLPNSTKCFNCSEALSGTIRFRGGDHGSSSTMFSVIGENGDVIASCSYFKNPQCLDKCIRGSVLELGERELQAEMKLFYSESRVCDWCLKSSIFSHRCSACLAAQYCSTQCQHKDLDFHKTVCSKWAKDQSRQIISGGKQKRLYKALLGVDKK